MSDTANKWSDHSQAQPNQYFVGLAQSFDAGSVWVEGRSRNQKSFVN